jgi:hypothetical protein
MLGACLVWIAALRVLLTVQPMARPAESQPAHAEATSKGAG